MITSSRNPKIQSVRDLQAHAKARREQGEFVIEGVRLIEEAVRSGWKLPLVLWSDELSERGRMLLEQLASRGGQVEAVKEEVLQAISDTHTPQGILAIAEMRALPLPPHPDFVLLLDNLRDPGNMGTILRTASAAGVQVVLLSPGCADPYAPKVVRSAMGAHFRLSVQFVSWDDARAILQPLWPHVYLADAQGEVLYTRADFRQPLALIVGSEADGVGPEAQALAKQRIAIPMPGYAESLNAAIAAAILMFEVVRQRTR